MSRIVIALCMSLLFLVGTAEAQSTREVSYTPRACTFQGVPEILPEYLR